MVSLVCCGYILLLEHSYLTLWGILLIMGFIVIDYKVKEK